ncbi:MAG: HEPN domain-containing protein [Nanoarchaeota archaeon]
MEIRNTEDCFRFRLLRKIKPDKTKSQKSLEIAESRFKRAKEALRLNVFDFVILEAYMSMFHAARALLYKDGIQEKSHYAISVYLKEKYSNKIPLPVINFLEIHRTERHEAMYGLEYQPVEKDAELALQDAEIFINEIKKILS